MTIQEVMAYIESHANAVSGTMRGDSEAEFLDDVIEKLKNIDLAKSFPAGSIVRAFGRFAPGRVYAMVALLSTIRNLMYEDNIGIDLIEDYEDGIANVVSSELLNCDFYSTKEKAEEGWRKQLSKEEKKQMEENPLLAKEKFIEWLYLKATSAVGLDWMLYGSERSIKKQKTR